MDGMTETRQMLVWKYKKKKKGKQKKRTCEAPTAFPVSLQCFSSAQETGSLGLNIFIYLIFWQDGDHVMPWTGFFTY